MANVNFIKFFKQSAAPENVAGNIWFDKSTNLIKVGNGTSWEEFGGVVDAKFENSVLTIRKANDVAFTLDFSDVASAENVNSLLGTLRTDINALKGRVDNHDTSLASLNTSITNLDAAYKAADASLKTELVADASADYNTLGKLQAKIEAEASARSTEDASVLEAAKKYADTKGAAATTKVAEGTDAGNNMTIESSIDASGATTYTISLTDVASASAFVAHDGSADIHVTKAQKDAWQDATDAINAFITSDSAQNAALDTLKEIQDFLSADDGAVKALTSKVDANEAAIKKLNGDASTAGSVAKAVVDAKADLVGDAAEGYNTLGKLEDKIQAEALARENADKDLDAKITAITNGTNAVISFGGAKGAISVDTAPDSDGDVAFVMDGSTLTGHVKGIKSAAFAETTAFDAAGAAADVKDEVTGTAADAADKVTLYGVKAYADALKADADSSIDALQTLVGSTDVSTQISSAIAELDSTLDATEGKYVEKVVIVDGKIDATASVVKSLPAATVEGVDEAAKSNNYVSIATTLVNKNVVVTPTVTLQDVSTAGDNAKGLAEASDVKSYVDNQIATNALAWSVLE